MRVLSVLTGSAERLRGQVGATIRRTLAWMRAHGFTRVQWWAKWRILRGYQVSLRDLDAWRYLLLDPELTNFTYPLANEDELIDWVASVLSAERSQIAAYVAEAHEDEDLAAEIKRQVPARRKGRHPSAWFGRRLGWYAITRALKPSLVVETGIDAGHGSLLLLRALEHNANEGYDGELVSFDINPQAGWLVPERMRNRWHAIYASTFDALEPAVAGREVGMLVHDSEHTYECERFEFRAALAHRASKLALLSDNAHVTTALRDVCAAHGADYHYFQERPEHHFYRGAGIGFGLITG